MDKVILANKKIGETPLDAINKLRTESVKLKNLKMAYAGRLDPMAEGLLLILVDDECKKREKYQNFKKEYEFEVLFGISTDTYDLLGKITSTSSPTENLESELKKVIPTFSRTLEQKYPPYSAARVAGKPLYYWAREGKLDQIKIPSKKIDVYSLYLVDFRTMLKDELTMQIFEKLNKIHGNFRQDEIKNIWRDYFNNTESELFEIAKFKIKCSSGTYVRSIANELGKKLGCYAIAFSIKRTKIGKYRLS